LTVRDDLSKAFPSLAVSDYRVTSPETPAYNCIAWAAGEATRWWWPDAFGVAYWPPGVAREETIDAFTQAYATLGYAECDSEYFEEGLEKIAIYAVGDKPKHAARQIGDNRWASKLGRGLDIEHSLKDLESELYGRVVKIMHRADQ